MEVERHLLREMIRIRRTEETLAELYPAQEMRTPTHFSIGQEAVAVGVCAALRRTDAVYSGHRCHAHYLAKGGNLDAMVAELYGKVTGCARGRGGSVHLSDLDAGVIAFPPNPLTIARSCLEVLKAGSSGGKGVADVQATFAGPY